MNDDSSVRLLVVDDDCSVASLVQAMLRGHPVHIFHALDGPSGLQLLASQPFDAALIDLRLPRMSGWEVAQRVRADGYTLPLWIISAQYTEADVPQPLLNAIDARGFLPKPLRRELLLSALRPHLKLADRHKISV